MTTATRLFLIDKATGEEREVPVSAFSFERLPVIEDFEGYSLPAEMSFSFPIHHITRRQWKTWLKLAGLPSGRRAARRRRKRGNK